MGISFNAASLLNGNGIDVTSLVDTIQSQRSGQLKVWQQQQSDLQSQATTLGTLNTDLNNLETAINALKDPVGALTAMSATSSLPGILTASAQISAAAGSHVVIVSAGTVYTDAVAGGADVSILPSGTTGGDLQLRIGGPSGATKDIQITAGSNDTLTKLASYINQQSTQNNWGVTAAVLSDATGARLTIYSQATGTPGALAITGNTATSLVFEAPVGGVNAALTIDGIPFSSTTNTVTGAIAGVTLNLVSAEPAVPLQLAVGPDTTQATNGVNAFVIAYNTLMTAINHQFAVDPNTKMQGALGSDGSLRSLQSRLLADANYSLTGNGGLVNLHSLGIKMNDDGTLTLDNTALSSALSANPSAFLNFFQNTGQTGFANNFGKDLISLTDSVNGVLNLDLAQNASGQTNLTKEINSFQDRLAGQRQHLIAQFSQVNAALEAYPFVLAEINAALGNTAPITRSNSTPTTSTPTSKV
jgi:flagellar hook-associated protein 2